MASVETKMATRRSLFFIKARPGSALVAKGMLLMAACQ